MKVPYRCLYNHELLGLGTIQTPYASYSEPLDDRQPIGMVRELKETGVEALMICPQAWQTHLWTSEVDRHWQDVAPKQREPLPEADWKYFDKAYYRLRRYMLSGADPVGLTVRTARECGIAPILSYRMNEGHFVLTENCSTHNAFWKSHPEWRLNGGRGTLNYLVPEVRERLLALIFELLEQYDVDGFECDFMRQLTLFPPGREKEGKEPLTAMVRAIREKLDGLGKMRGKRLALGVRVPRTPVLAEAAGLDVARWAQEGWLDMVNATSSFRISPEVDLEGYRALCPNASLFGELHFVSQAGERLPGLYANNINRKTNSALYRSTALTFLERGADGISLFNFGYVRDHSFHEPRRQGYPGVEPPFSVIASLIDPARLRDGSQHLALTPDFDSLPVRLADGFQGEFRMYLPDAFSKPFARAQLRLEANGPIAHVPGFAVSLNDAALGEEIVQGELFPPLTIEALPDLRWVRHFTIPTGAARPGWNRIELQLDADGHNWGYWGDLKLVRIELALHR